MIRSPIEVFPNNVTIDLYGKPDSYEGKMKIQTTGEVVERICIVSSLNLQTTTTVTKQYTGLTLCNNDTFTFKNWISPVTEKMKNVSIIWKANMFSPECTKLYGNKTIRDYSDSTEDFFIVVDYDEGIKGNYIKSGSTTAKDVQYTGILYDIKINGTIYRATPKHYWIEDEEEEETGAWETRLYCSYISLTESDIDSTVIEVYTNCTESETFNYYTATTPELTFTVQAIITEFSYDFTATYSQAQHIPPKYFIYNLYNNQDKLIQTSGKIYSSNLFYTIDNLLDGDYSIELKVYNQKDVLVSARQDFSVAIATTELGYSLDLDFEEDKGCARVQWNGYKQSKGQTTNTFTYEITPWNSSYKNVVMGANTSITYNKVNTSDLVLSAESVILYSGILQGTKILEFNFKHNYYESGTGNGTFTLYTSNGDIYASLTFSDKDSARTVTKEKFIISLLQQSQTCFNDSLIPAASRTNRYMLLNDAIWTVDNTYFITNESSDIQYFNSHYKINIIPARAIDSVFENTVGHDGIYIYKVDDIDEG